jgi:hypothetical protein
MALARRRAEETVRSRRILGGKARHQIGTDFVIGLAGSSGQARREGWLRLAPSRAIAATVASATPASAPRQPACAAPITRATRIGEKDRAAIGGRHANGETGRAGNDGVSARASVRPPRRLSATTTWGEWIW